MDKRNELTVSDNVRTIPREKWLAFKPGNCSDGVNHPHSKPRMTTRRRRGTTTAEKVKNGVGSHRVREKEKQK